MMLGTLRAGLCAAIGGFALAASGCKHESKFEFDVLDVAPAREELAELPLGEYRIPIPVSDVRGQEKRLPRNRMQLDFQLVALVPPGDEAKFADAWERHEGKIRDRVIQVCRNASSEELLEPEMTTLKAKLIDALASQMGEKEVRQLLMTDVVSQPL
jgi:hypothetical protein